MAHRSVPVSGLADVTACLCHPSLSSAVARRSFEGVASGVSDTFLTVLDRQMDLLDPPHHRILRTAFRKAFDATEVHRLREFAERWVDTRLSTRPRSFDLLDEIARPLPLAVVMELLGVPSASRTAFHRHVAAFVAGLRDPVTTQPAVQASLQSLRALVAATLERSDLVDGTLLSIVRDIQPPLDLDDVIANVILTVAAGHHTTTNVIGNGAWLLLANDRQRSLLASRPELWPGAIDEMLRFESPVQSVRRLCTAHLEINGQRFEAGDEIVLMLGHANRDPREFDRPGEFDVTRTPNRHVAFGAGPHLCLGAQLARMQAHAALTRVFALEGLRAAVSEPQWMPPGVYRGLQRLPVTRT